MATSDEGPWIAAQPQWLLVVWTVANLGFIESIFLQNKALPRAFMRRRERRQWYKWWDRVPLSYPSSSFSLAFPFFFFSFPSIPWLRDCVRCFEWEWGSLYSEKCEWKERKGIDGDYERFGWCLLRKQNHSQLLSLVVVRARGVVWILNISLVFFLSFLWFFRRQ